jgi:hypothetical protein
MIAWMRVKVYAQVAQGRDVFLPHEEENVKE